MNHLLLGPFLKAVFGDWLARMTGPLSLILLFAPLLIPRTTAQYPGGNTLIWIVAFVCLCVSSYRIWLSEHRARLAQGLEPLIEDARQLRALWATIQYEYSKSELIRFPLGGFDVEKWEEVHKQLLRLFFWTGIQGQHAEKCFVILGIRERPRLAEVIGDQFQCRSINGLAYTKLIDDHLALLENSRKRIAGKHASAKDAVFEAR